MRQRLLAHQVALLMVLRGDPNHRLRHLEEPRKLSHISRLAER